MQSHVLCDFFYVFRLSGVVQGNSGDPVKVDERQIRARRTIYGHYYLDILYIFIWSGYFVCQEHYSFSYHVEVDEFLAL